MNNRRNLLTIRLSENLNKWKRHRSDENPNQMISDLFTWLHEYMNEEREGVRMLLIEEDGSDAHFVMSCMDVIFSGANKFVQEFLIPFSRTIRIWFNFSKQCRFLHSMKTL